jgi:hypothetical protein
LCYNKSGKPDGNERNITRNDQRVPRVKIPRKVSNTSTEQKDLRHKGEL